MPSSDRERHASDRPVLPSIHALFGDELSRSPHSRRPGARAATPAARPPHRMDSTPYAGQARLPAAPPHPAIAEPFPGYPQAYHSALQPHPPPHTSPHRYPTRGTQVPQSQMSHPLDMYNRPIHAPAFDSSGQRWPHYPMGHTVPGPAQHYSAGPTAHHSRPEASTSYASYQQQAGPSQSPRAHHYSGGSGPDDNRMTHSHYHPGQASMTDQADTSGMGSSNSKYECTYCGKGFTRPSSLKIHMNSHTGEKPFVCPVEGCGRSFSVLSNMRRHSRVHSQGTLKEAGYDDDGVDPPQPSGSSGDSAGPNGRRSPNDSI